MPIETHLLISDTGLDPVTLLAEATGLSRGRIKAAMTKGAVWRQSNSGKPRRLRRVNRNLASGDRLSLYYDETILAQTPEPPTLIADETDYSVWRKPRGLLSQGSRWGDHCAMPRCVEQQLNRATVIVHRLDRAATGLILLAHNRRAASALSRLFRERQINKRYRVIVRGRFPATATLDAPLDDKPAITHARLLAHDHAANLSLLEITLATGRKHQIRRHLAQAGHPVIGDRLHGNDASADLQLQAAELAFTCPIHGQERCYRLPAADRLGL